MQKIKHTIFEIIDPTHADDGVSRAFNIGMLILIVINILAVVLETEEGLYSQIKHFSISLMYSQSVFLLLNIYFAYGSAWNI